MPPAAKSTPRADAKRFAHAGLSAKSSCADMPTADGPDGIPVCCTRDMPETLHGIAGRTAPALAHSHAVLDDIDRVLFGPSPCCDQPCKGEPGCLEEMMQDAAESSVRLAARLERVRERLS